MCFDIVLILCLVQSFKYNAKCKCKKFSTAGWRPRPTIMVGCGHPGAWQCLGHHYELCVALQESASREPHWPTTKLVMMLLIVPPDVCLICTATGETYSQSDRLISCPWVIGSSLWLCVVTSCHGNSCFLFLILGNGCLTQHSCPNFQKKFVVHVFLGYAFSIT